MSRAQSPERATSVPSSHGFFTGHFILRTILAKIYTTNHSGKPTELKLVFLMLVVIEGQN